jgi:pre-mRNA-splicing factor CDC5/CEF1
MPMIRSLSCPFSLPQQKAKALSKSVTSLDGQLKEARMELSAFELLRSHEQQAIPARKESLQQEVAAQEKRQTDLQLKYKALVSRLQE